MNYEPLHAFAEKHRVSYNELCAAARAALAAPAVPLTVEAIREAIDDAGLDWHNGWTVGDDSENRYLNLARAIERTHGICHD